MFANINSTQLAYTDEGVGLPMVFIHGFPLNRKAWSEQVEAFKSAYRVIAPDLSGFGDSQPAKGSLSMGHYAEQIRELLLQLAVGPVILGGHAMGGNIALSFVNRYPELVRGLVLVGTKAGPDTFKGAQTRRDMASAVRDQGTAVMTEVMMPRLLSADNTDKAMAALVQDMVGSASRDGIIGALLGMAERPDAREWLRHIRVPTLVIEGSDDESFSSFEADALVEAIPEARLRVIPHAGHLVAMEQPEAFNQAMKHWLAWGCKGPSLGKSKIQPPMAPGQQSFRSYQQQL
jgi:3-oxoadipate enol-lactonase